MERMRTFAPQTWLRREPDVSAEALLGLPAGTELDVLETRGPYYRVSYRIQSGDEIVGFVAQSFLRSVDAEEGPSGSTQPQTDAAPLPPKFERTVWLAAGMGVLLLTNSYLCTVGQLDRAL
ncbi:MAG: SH3 domain-containing protein [Bacillota bacterium]|jgi:hypothetical protein